MKKIFLKNLLERVALFMDKNIYFLLNDDFKTIIKNTLLDNMIFDIKHISTGWTNIVFEVTTDSRKLFF